MKSITTLVSRNTFTSPVPPTFVQVPYQRQNLLAIDHTSFPSLFPARLVPMRAERLCVALPSAAVPRLVDANLSNYMQSVLFKSFTMLPFLSHISFMLLSLPTNVSIFGFIRIQTRGGIEIFFSQRAPVIQPFPANLFQRKTGCYLPSDGIKITRIFAKRINIPRNRIG